MSDDEWTGTELDTDPLVPQPDDPPPDAAPGEPAEVEVPEPADSGDYPPPREALGDQDAAP